MQLRKPVALSSSCEVVCPWYRDPIDMEGKPAGPKKMLMKARFMILISDLEQSRIMPVALGSF